MSTWPRPVTAATSVLASLARSAVVWPRLWATVALVAVGFLAFGGDSLATSSRAVLHGLCAQRPTHSFTIGGTLLPFDARMTGIYSGALAAWLVLAARGRLLAAATPTPRVVIALTLAVVALGVDGFNAFFVDLGVWHPYQPMNQIRLLTGFGTGISIVSLEVWLIGGTVWNLATSSPSWDRAREILWALPMALLLLGVIELDMAWTYPILALALLVSAWITVSGLCLVIILSLFRIDLQVRSVRDLEWPLIASVVLAIAIIVGLAQLRFWLERTLGIPQDFVAMSGGTAPTILSGMIDWFPLNGVV